MQQDPPDAPATGWSRRFFVSSHAAASIEAHGPRQAQAAALDHVTWRTVFGALKAVWALFVFLAATALTPSDGWELTAWRAGVAALMVAPVMGADAWVSRRSQKAAALRDQDANGLTAWQGAIDEAGLHMNVIHGTQATFPWASAPRLTWGKRALIVADRMGNVSMWFPLELFGSDRAAILSFCRAHAQSHGGALNVVDEADA
jgi:hypothetical protein